ncbi:MAG: protoheme IX farnesyltransferase [Candidatus Omnitrophica bacterium]|nr:protoheme IX farnesyltransferase [Candidatus Omnitrophota bacterium]
MTKYLELTKVRLTVTVAITTLVGYLMGHPALTPQLLAVMSGALLLGGGANTLNQVLEKDVDARMSRTKNRPLPSGRLGSLEAAFFGLTLIVGGLFILFFGVNTLTMALGGLTVCAYLFVYTPLKRKTALNTFVGAIPGAIPIVMGWTAAGQALNERALALFGILYFWQLPHFLAIARLYKEDYTASGLKMMATQDADGQRAAWMIALYSALFVPISVSPSLVGLTGDLYFAGALLAGTGFLAFTIYLFITKLAQPKMLVPASILYLLCLLIFMVADARTLPGASTALPRYGQVQKFDLVDQNSRTTTSDELKGKPWVGSFMFTRCAGQCPLMNVKISGLQKKLPPSVKLISFSVDPEYDSPAVLKNYSQNYNPEPNRWLFLTGQKPIIDEVLKSFYVNTSDDPGMHSLRLALVDQTLQIRGYYDSSDPEAMQKLARDAQKL